MIELTPKATPSAKKYRDSSLRSATSRRSDMARRNPSNFLLWVCIVQTSAAPFFCGGVVAGFRSSILPWQNRFANCEVHHPQKLKFTLALW